MKRTLIFLTSLLTISAQAQTHDWENPAVLGINKLPYHATLQLPSKWKACKEIVSLDGEWLFHWSRNPEERQTDFYREDYDVSSWGKIKVPGNWQTQGDAFEESDSPLRRCTFGHVPLGEWAEGGL